MTKVFVFREDQFDCLFPDPSTYKRVGINKDYNIFDVEISDLKQLKNIQTATYNIEPLRSTIAIFIIGAAVSPNRIKKSIKLGEIRRNCYQMLSRVR